MGIWCKGSKFFKYCLTGNYLSHLSNSKLPALNSKLIPAPNAQPTRKAVIQNISTPPVFKSQIRISFYDE